MTSYSFVKLVTALVAVFLTMSFQSAAPAFAAAGADDGRCAALLKADFTTLRDAPFVLTSATVVSDDGAAYCRATGFVQPEITFEMRLPLAGWSRGFMLVGSGGWANRKKTELCAQSLRRGYACIAGDGGHQQNSGLWMQANAQAKIDWGYRATHVTALAGKALVANFYGTPPTLSLMLGCSTGGYQGLVEAQRFPWDFQGILAVAPDIDQGDLAMRTAWAARHMLDDDGAPMFAAADLAVLHRAALAACDMTDGVRDGIIGDAMACRFDPRTTVCRGGKTTDCLSERQVLAATRIYEGPRTSAGQRLSTAGPFPGSELMWPNVLEDVSFAHDFFRFALTDSPRDGFAAAEFDYDEDYKRLGLAGTFVSSNPDLRRYRDAGGKLIIVQGTNDVTEQGRAAIDYYETVERVGGGRAATQGFARLFVVPGMNHCSGGDGAFAVDWLGALEAWVARGTAPAALIAAHVPKWKDGGGGFDAGMTVPGSGDAVTFTRPVFPYPLHAHYRGSGDPNEAASFRAKGPATGGAGHR